MAQGVKRTNTSPRSLVKAWREGGEIEVTKAAILKYARVLDVSDAGRDIKPLITGMFEAIDRLKALEASQGGKEDSPLFTIMAKAEAQRKAM